MKSTTKRRLSEAEIGAVVRRAFGPEARAIEVEELSEGAMNAVYRLGVDGGPPRIVLKVGSAPDAPLLTYEVDALRTEIAFYELARGAFPLPGVHFVDTSRTVVEVDYMVMDHVDATPWTHLLSSIPAERQAGLHRDLGQMAGRLHRITGTRFGYLQPGTPQGDTWRSAFLQMVDAVLDDAVAWKVILPADPEDVRGAARGLAGYLDDVPEPKLVHFDLLKYNVLVSGEGGDWRIEAVIDGERAFWGDPVAELVNVNPMRDPMHPAFLDGYAETAESPIEPTPSVHARLALYQLYAGLVLLVQAVPHGYLDGSPEDEQTLRYRSAYEVIGRRVAELVGACHSLAASAGR